MAPIEDRTLNETRSRETDRSRGSTNAHRSISEKQRANILVMVFVFGSVIFVIISLHLCRKSRRFLRMLTCNAGASRRERFIEEGPKTPTRRRVTEEMKERWEIHNRKRLKKTLIAIETEQHREAHSVWLKRVQERERRAYLHKWDLKKKEHHLLHDIHKLHGRPRTALEERHREQRLEDLETSLEQRHQRLEVLQKEINESLGTQLRIRAQRSEDSVAHTRPHSRVESRENVSGRADYEISRVPTSSQVQPKLEKHDKKVSGPRKKSIQLPHPGKHHGTLKTSDVPRVEQSKPDDRRISLSDPTGQVMERKSIPVDTGTIRKSSLKPPHRLLGSATLDQTKPVTESYSKPPDISKKSVDELKPVTERKSDIKSSDSRKTVDQSKSFTERKSNLTPFPPKKSVEDTDTKPRTSSKKPIENFGIKVQRHLSRGSDIKDEELPKFSIRMSDSRYSDRGEDPAKDGERTKQDSTVKPGTKPPDKEDPAKRGDRTKQGSTIQSGTKPPDKKDPATGGDRTKRGSTIQSGTKTVDKVDSTKGGDRTKQGSTIQSGTKSVDKVDSTKGENRTNQGSTIQSGTKSVDKVDSTKGENRTKQESIIKSGTKPPDKEDRSKDEKGKDTKPPGK